MNRAIKPLVLSLLVAGALSVSAQNATVCRHASYTLATPSAVSASYTYRWQSSTDDAAWSDLTTWDAYAPYTLTDITAPVYARLQADTNADNVADTLIVHLSLSLYPSAQLLSVSVPAQVCPGSTASVSVAASSGVRFTLQSTADTVGGSVSTVVAGSTSTALTTAAIASTVFHRVIATHTVCGDTDTSHWYKTEPYAAFTAGTIAIAGADTVCYDKTPGVLGIATAFSGGAGMGTYSYQWQSSTDGATGWTAAQGSNTGTTYNAGQLRASVYYRLQARDLCGEPMSSNTVRVHVYSKMTKPRIATAQTGWLCYDSVPSEVRVTTLPTGSTGVYHYQWEDSTGASGWQPIAGAADATSYQPGRLRVDTRFRVVATPEGCGTEHDTSNSVLIKVYERLRAGHVLPVDTTICYNTEARLRVSPSGAAGAGDYRYQWQVSTGGTAFTAATGSTATAQNYATGALTADRYYRVLVSSAAGCSQDYSDTVRVRVRDEFRAGTIAIAGADTVCYDKTPGVLGIATAFSGGAGMGTYSYQWQSSTDGATGWTAAQGSNTGTTYNAGQLRASVYYRLQARDLCGEPMSSNTVRVHVYSKMTKPRIATAQTGWLCYDSVPSEVRVTTLPTGSTGVYHYQWEDSTGASGWQPIAGAADATSYQPGRLRVDTRFRVVATPEGCGTEHDTSNSVLIKVYERLRAGHVLPVDTTICYNTEARLRVSPSGAAGAGDYRYQWQVSTGGTAFTAATGSTATAQNYATGALTADRYYRVLVSSAAGCSQDMSDVVRVRVFRPFEQSMLTADGATILDSACYGFYPSHRNIVPGVVAQGGARPYTYQWVRSTDGVHYAAVGGETDSVYSFSEVIRESAYWRLISTSARGCGSDTSNRLFVKMNPLPSLPVIIGDSVDMCANQQDVEYKVDAVEEGISYQWTVENGTLSSADTLPSVLVSWADRSGGSSKIRLQLTNDITGCQNTKEVEVEISPTYIAPPKTHIKIKTAAYILVCADTTRGAHYAWGYTNKQTHVDVEIPNSDCRYIKLPEAIDTAMYDYYVDIRYGTTPCVTRTYYSKDERSEDWWSDGGGTPTLTVSPNPSKGIVHYKLDTDLKGKYRLTVHDVHGRMVVQKEYSDYVGEVYVKLEVVLPRGMYIITVEADDVVAHEKIVVE